MILKDIAEFQFDYTNRIKLKTFIDKIRNLTKFSIFFSSSFKSLMTWSIDGRKTWRVWKTYFWHRFIDWWQIINTFFPVSHQIITKIVIWMLVGGRTTKTSKRDIASMLRHESSGWHFVYYFHFTLSSGILNICLVRLPALFAAW